MLELGVGGGDVMQLLLWDVVVSGVCLEFGICTLVCSL